MPADSLKDQVTMEMREAADSGFKGMVVSPNQVVLIDLAVAVALRLVEAAEKRAEAAEKERNDTTRRLAESNARIQNEIAARQRAQEHGIGDRARIEELEGALAEYREKVCGCGHPKSEFCAPDKEADSE